MYKQFTVYGEINDLVKTNSKKRHSLNIVRVEFKRKISADKFSKKWENSEFFKNSDVKCLFRVGRPNLPFRRNNHGFSREEGTFFFIIFYFFSIFNYLFFFLFLIIYYLQQGCQMDQRN